MYHSPTGLKLRRTGLEECDDCVIGVFYSLTHSSVAARAAIELNRCDFALKKRGKKITQRLRDFYDKRHPLPFFALKRDRAVLRLDDPFDDSTPRLIRFAFPGASDEKSVSFTSGISHTFNRLPRRRIIDNLRPRYRQCWIQRASAFRLFMLRAAYGAFV